jgi:hypothetical protein
VSIEYIRERLIQGEGAKRVKGVRFCGRSWVIVESG